MIRYILEFLVLAGCILLTIKPNISNYRPQEWWNRRRLITYRVLFAIFTLIMIGVIYQSITTGTLS